MISTILGAGILGLPYAFSRSGWLLGYLLLVLSSIFALIGLLLLQFCADKTSHAQPVSFHSVAAASSARFAPLIDLAVLIKCFGVATAYLIVVGDMATAAIRYLSSSTTISRGFAIVAGFIIAAPLSCFHNLDALKYTSSLSLLLILALFVVVVMYTNENLLDPCEDSSSLSCSGNRYLFAESSGDVFKILPVFIFGFTCHQNSFSVINELCDPSVRRIAGVFVFSIIIALCLYCAIATSGYHTYGSFVQSDLLKSYPQNGLLATLRLSVAFIETFHYPLQINPARRSALSLIEYFLDHQPSTIMSPQKYYVRYTVVTFVLLTASVGIALTVSDLGIVIELVGATGSLFVSYIIPGALFLSLYPATAMATAPDGSTAFSASSIPSSLTYTSVSLGTANSCLNLENQLSAVDLHTSDNTSRNKYMDSGSYTTSVEIQLNSANTINASSLIRATNANSLLVSNLRTLAAIQLGFGLTVMPICIMCILFVA